MSKLSNCSKLITRLSSERPSVRNAAFNELIREIQELHNSKNHDYAADADPLSNLRKCESMGVPAWKGVLVRLTDKWSRIEQLSNGKVPKHESLRDSLIDNAVYSLLCVILLDEQTRGSTDASLAAAGSWSRSSAPTRSTSLQDT
jgi:hypothetical protein